MTAMSADRTVIRLDVGGLDIGPAGHVIEAMTAALAAHGSIYGDPRGLPEFREAVAEHLSATRGLDVRPDHVIAQPGGTAVVGKFLAVAAPPGSEVLVPVPGFPVYRAAARHVGATPVSYRYDVGPATTAIDIDSLHAAVSPRTSAIIVNAQHNPTGADASVAELEAIADIAAAHELAVLADEAYFDIRYDARRSTSIAALDGMSERTAILMSFSKSHAMAGLRLGAVAAPPPLVGPLAERTRMSEFCVQAAVQLAGVAALRGPQDFTGQLRRSLADRRRAVTAAIDRSPMMTAHRPATTFYAYVDVTEAIAAAGVGTVGAFVDALDRDCGVVVCPDTDFGVTGAQPRRSHIRIAFGAHDESTLVAAIERIDRWIEQVDDRVEPVLPVRTQR
jgi:aspartate/methionine/tyrosine aminotransferase